MRARFVTLALVLLPAMPLGSAVGQQVPRDKGDAQLDAVADRVVVTATAPIPEVGAGAPRFTSEDIRDIQIDATQKALQADRDLERCGPPKGYLPPICNHKSLTGLLACEKDAARKVDLLAQEASKATAEVEAARHDSALASTERQAVEEAERQRQLAVTKMEQARAALFEAQADVAVWQDMMLRGRTQNIELDVMAAGLQRKKAREAGYQRSIGGLSVADVQAVLVDEGGARLLRLTGRIVNDERGGAAMPGLTAFVLDDRGWVLATHTVTASDRSQISGKSSRAFQFEVGPVPRATHKAVVAFASSADPPPRNGIGAFRRRQ